MGSRLALSQTSVTIRRPSALTPSPAGEEDPLLRSPIPRRHLLVLLLPERATHTQAELGVLGRICTEQFQNSYRVLRVLEKPSCPGRYLQKEPVESQPLNSASLLWSWRPCPRQPSQGAPWLPSSGLCFYVDGGIKVASGYPIKRKNSIPHRPTQESIPARDAGEHTS